MNHYVIIPRSGENLDHIKFEPSIIKIFKGESITWMNRDTRVHELTSGDGDSSLPTEFFQTGSMLPGESTTIEIDTNQGSIPYYCSLHPLETGLIAILQEHNDQISTNIREPKLTKNVDSSLLAADNQKILTRLQRQVDPAIVEYLSDPNAPLIQNKVMTIVFWDISNFSDLSEKLKDHPELIAVFLNEYFEIAIPIIHEYHGVVDKFIGDGILAYFGFKETSGDKASGAVNAVLAALKLRNAFKILGKNWIEICKIVTSYSINIDVKCGINTGFVLVGLLGSGVRDQFTVVGTNVNLASRLEGKAQSNQIIISPSTMNNIKGKGGFEINAVKIEGEKIRAFENISEYYTVELL